MARTLRNFRVHGAYKTKRAAMRKEKSAACHDSCFILKRKVRRGTRYVVLERR